MGTKCRRLNFFHEGGSKATRHVARKASRRQSELIEGNTKDKKKKKIHKRSDSGKSICARVTCKEGPQTKEVRKKKRTAWGLPPIHRAGVAGRNVARMGDLIRGGLNKRSEKRM